jgi:hypothetical protein
MHLPIDRTTARISVVYAAAVVVLLVFETVRGSP